MVVASQRLCHFDASLESPRTQLALVGGYVRPKEEATTLSLHQEYNSRDWRREFSRRQTFHSVHFQVISLLLLFTFFFLIVVTSTQYKIGPLELFLSVRFGGVEDIHTVYNHPRHPPLERLLFPN